MKSYPFNLYKANLYPCVDLQVGQDRSFDVTPFANQHKHKHGILQSTGNVR